MEANALLARSNKAFRVAVLFPPMSAKLYWAGGDPAENFNYGEMEQDDMAIIIKRKTGAEKQSAKKKRQGHCKALPVTLDLAQPGRLRVGHCLTLLSVSHSSFYRGQGKQYPRPDGNDGRPYWNTSTLKALLTRQ